METRTFELESISYKRKEVEKGLVLGIRKNKGELARNSKPIWAKVKSRYISTLSPQRKDFQVYIPQAEIDMGLVFDLTEKNGIMSTTKYKVIEIGASNVICEVLDVKTWQPRFKTLEIVEGLTHEYVFGGAPIVETAAPRMTEPAPERSPNFEELSAFFEECAKEFQTPPVSAKVTRTLRTDGFLFDIHPTHKEIKPMSLFNLSEYTQAPAQEVLRLTGEPEPAKRPGTRIDYRQFPMFAPTFPTTAKSQAETIVDDLPIFEAVTPEKQAKNEIKEEVKKLLETIKGFEDTKKRDDQEFGDILKRQEHVFEHVVSERAENNEEEPPTACQPSASAEHVETSDGNDSAPAKTGITRFCKEMGEQRPENIQGELDRSYDAKHWYLETPLTLQGRGITFLRVLRADHLHKHAHYKDGWNEYRLTDKALETLQTQYHFSQEIALD